MQKHWKGKTRRSLPLLHLILKYIPISDTDDYETFIHSEEKLCSFLAEIVSTVTVCTKVRSKGKLACEAYPKKAANLLVSGAYTGKMLVVKAMLSARANPDTFGDWSESPLTAAAGNGHANVVSLLLQAHADPNMSDLNGETPLTVAAMNGHAKVVMQLIAALADLNRCD